MALFGRVYAILAALQVSAQYKRMYLGEYEMMYAQLGESIIPFQDMELRHGDDLLDKWCRSLPGLWGFYVCVGAR